MLTREVAAPLIFAATPSKHNSRDRRSTDNPAALCLGGHTCYGAMVYSGLCRMAMGLGKPCSERVGDGFFLLNHRNELEINPSIPTLTSRVTFPAII